MVNYIIIIKRKCSTEGGEEAEHRTGEAGGPEELH